MLRIYDDLALRPRYDICDTRSFLAAFSRIGTGIEQKGLYLRRRTMGMWTMHLSHQCLLF